MSFLISKKEMVSISLGYVSNSSDAPNKYSCVLTVQDFSIQRINLLNFLQEFNFDRTIKYGFPRLKAFHCGAYNNNNFVIDPNGNIYRCWEDICHTHWNVGNVYNFNDYNICNENKCKWNEYSPFNNEQCLSCNVLPLCGGGCPREYIYFGKNTRCDPLKHNITKIMQFYALYNLNKRR
jgi:uncharacterized protein